MGRFSTFEHTADLGLRIEADSLNDLFRTAAEGLLGCVVANRADVRAARSESVALAAESTADLLANWLAELIFRIETEHCLYRTFEVAVAADGLSLHATIAGEPIDPDRHQLDHEVKAVTKHGLCLEHADSRWIAEVIVDI